LQRTVLLNALLELVQRRIHHGAERISHGAALRAQEALELFIYLFLRTVKSLARGEKDKRK
jgi:hypothetical protein